MEQQSLAVETRQNTGKGIARKIRKSGKLPGVLYGLGNCVPVVVDPRIIHKFLMEEGGRNKVLTVKGSGVEGKSVLIKDYQVDPVSRQLLHVDLLEIDINKKILVTVTLNVIGKSVGVAEGGVLNMIERTVDVKCLPTAIPKHIDVDVTALNIGNSLHLDDLKFPAGVEKALQGNPTLITCVPPTKEEEAAPSLAPTAEPEVITAKAPAEGAEGAAPAAEAKGGDAGGKKEDKKK